MFNTRLCVMLFASAAVYGQTHGRVTGRVAAENGSALSASVTVFRAGKGLQLKSVPTDDRGVFSFDIPLGPASISVRADGYASEQRDILVRPGRGNANLNFKLPPASSLSGRVVDPSGNGVAGARVWVNYLGTAGSWRTADEIGGEQADDFGNFMIPAVAQGRPFVLHAVSEGWLLSSTQTMNIHIREIAGVLLLMSRRGAAVSGRVVDAAGRPMPGVRVHLRSVPNDAEFTAEQRSSSAFAHSMQRTAVSQEDGAYIFTGVPGGRIIVQAETARGRAASDVEVAAGRDVLGLDLRIR